ncbi:hypothetical protein [Kosakonia oryzae]|uniref:Bacteriocin n=1 Tax=Kosakonia oryzae TaxID=497725 RepID=A0AA94H2I1_9ENTR|nr:hypothetical protein [Kosakonia oryzae]ANI82979.1 hypothetical protein AWR26_12720 [Kosakonia oryzae]SFC13785.1 hypothetical protein SAMN05216286_1719 [Kosakonia oryzae]
MKELNNNEMMAVSGAGFLSDAAGAFGGGLGGIVDIFLGGKKTTFSDAGRSICESIAGVFESGYDMAKNAISGLFGGILGMFGKDK